MPYPSAHVHLDRERIINIARAVLMGMAIYEGATGIGQMTGLWHNAIGRHLLTGSFTNPGPYGCYMAVMLTVAVATLRRCNRGVMYWLAWAVVAVSAVVIPASLSRTAWVATAAGMAVVWSDRIVAHKRRILPAAVITAIFGIGAYSIKARSADGRILMWRIATEALTEVPAAGVGWDNVMGAYGDAQERYFSEAGRSKDEIMTADVPEYTFNEYLRVGIACGPMAMAVMVIMLAGSATVAWRSSRRDIAAGVVTAAVVMTASYPLQFSLSTFTIGLLTALGYLSARRNAWASGICAAIVLSATAMTIKATKAMTDVHHEFAVARSLHAIGRHSDSNAILHRIAAKSADPMILNIAGKNYRALGMPDSAALYYRRASKRCPNRLYPHYLLMTLWADTAYVDSAAMMREARILVDMPEKVASPATLQMKNEARKILNIR